MLTESLRQQERLEYTAQPNSFHKKTNLIITELKLLDKLSLERLNTHYHAGAWERGECVTPIFNSRAYFCRVKE
jgi:hypothetical protein